MRTVSRIAAARWIVTGMAWGIVAGATLGAAPGDDGPTITAKHTRPQRLIFREHSGPYWRVGPALVEAQAYMREQGGRGPIFTRYSGHPLTDLGASLRRDVGFFTDRALTPRHPFRAERRAPQLVASMVVEGRAPTARRDYARLYQWIADNGHEAAGEVYEIYVELPDAIGAGVQRTEIQAVLRDPSREKETPAESPVDTEGPSPEGSPSAHRAAVPAQSDLATPTQPLGSVPIQKAPAPSVPVEVFEIGGGPVSTKTPSVAAQSKPAKTFCEGATVDALYRQRRFDCIAARLMPEDAELSSAMQLWFGQVIFRIGAVGKGLQRFHAEEAAPMLAAIEAITNRYRRFSASFKVDPLSQAIVRVEAGGDGPAKTKRTIMRDLDRLLGRIALRSVSVEAALTELVDLLERVSDVVSREATAGDGNSENRP